MGVEIVELQFEQKCMKEENEQSNNEVTIYSASKAEVEESFSFAAEKLRQTSAEKVELDQQSKAVVDKKVQVISQLIDSGELLRKRCSLAWSFTHYKGAGKIE